VSNLVKSIAASEGSVVNLTQKILATTYAITARIAFGKRNIHQEAFKLAIEEALILLGGVCIVDLYPSIKILRSMSRAKTKLEKAQRDLDTILQDIIDDHRREGSKDEDLVDILLNIQQENYHSQHPLTDDNLKAIIQVSPQPNMLTNLFSHQINNFFLVVLCGRKCILG
jgi:cytochrome P450